MRIYFDNCTSPVMARTLGGFLSNTNHKVEHARDLDLHKQTDVEWMKHLSSTGDEWLIVTGDGRIRKNKPEREAYRRAKLRGIVLAPAYQKSPMCKSCGMLVANWDSLFKFSQQIEPPFLIEMSINLTMKYKLLPL